MTSIHLNDIALRKKIEKLPLSYYINVKSESEFSKNFSKIFFFNVISQSYPKMVLRNAVLQKFCHHKNGSKPFPSLIGSLGLNLLKTDIVLDIKLNADCDSDIIFWYKMIFFLDMVENMSKIAVFSCFEAFKVF